MDTVFLAERGQITLPANVRKKYSLEKNTPLVLEETKDGRLLGKANVVALRHYTDEEINEWVKKDKMQPRDKKWLK